MMVTNVLSDQHAQSWEGCRSISCNGMNLNQWKVSTKIVVRMNQGAMLYLFRTQSLGASSPVTLQLLQSTLRALISLTNPQFLHQFDPSVTEELWQHCDINPDGEVYISSYIEVVLEAKEILQGKIIETKNAIRLKEQERQELGRKVEQARGNRHEGVFRELEQQMQVLEEIADLEEDLKEFEFDLRIIISPFLKAGENRTQLVESIIGPNHSIPSPLKFPLESEMFVKRSNMTLTSLFFLSILLLIMEMLMSLQKYNTLGPLVTIFLLSIFGLGYFSSSYVRGLLVGFGVSLLQDTFWLMAYLGSYWSPNKVTHLPSHYSGFLKLILLGVLVTIFLKVLASLILLSYINTQQKGEIDCCGYTLQIFPGASPLDSTPIVIDQLSP